MAQPNVFNRELLKQRRLRALNTATPGADFLMQAAAEDLAFRLQTVSRTFDLAVDLGGHTGRISKALQESGKAKQVLRGDLFIADPHLPAPDFIFDDEFPPLAAESVSLITSALSLQWVNDLPGALIQIRKSLKPDGLFLASLLGADTLTELRDVLVRAEIEVTGGVSPRVSPFADTRDLGALLQRAGFALPVTDLDRLTVRYANLFALLQDLRAMGATNVLMDRNKTPLSRDVLFKAAELYDADYSDEDGRIRATFSLVTLSGWAPHEDQQKPLRPGSAKTRLADALGAEEFKLKNK